MTALQVGDEIVPLQDHTEYSFHEQEQVRVLPEGDVLHIQMGLQHFTLKSHDLLLEALKIDGRTETSVPLVLTDQGQVQHIIVTVYGTHFNQDEIKQMVSDLQNVHYLWDANSPILTLTRSLHAHVIQLQELWHQVQSTWRRIQSQPAEHLHKEMDRVGLHEPLRMSSRALKHNLIRGHLDAEAIPLKDHLITERVKTTLDTPENAFVMLALRKFTMSRQTLLQMVNEEKVRLKDQQSNETLKYQIYFPLHYQQAYDMLERCRNTLISLPDWTIPAPWKNLKSRPNSQTNTVQFHPDYRKLHRLMKALSETPYGLHSDESALEAFSNLARRRTWQVYEYWVLSQCHQTLQAFKFAPISPLGFQAFEDLRGGTYGLREGTTVKYQHQSIPEFTVHLTYQHRHTDPQLGNLIPDVVLQAHLEGSAVKFEPLILDAKYRVYRQIEVQHQDLHQSARRYRNSMGGMAFLCHIGQDTRWPALVQDGTIPQLNLEDYPYRTGSIQLRPGRTRALSRVFRAYLFKAGCVRICYRCGSDLQVHSKPVPNRHQPRNFNVNIHPLARERPAFQCSVCKTLTYFNHCANPDRQTVVKFYPEGQNISKEWVEEVEIMQANPDRKMRACASCGDFGRTYRFQ